MGETKDAMNVGLFFALKKQKLFKKAMNIRSAPKYIGWTDSMMSNRNPVFIAR